MTNLEYCNEILSIIGNVTEANDAIYNLAFDAYLKLGGQESQPSLATIYNELKSAIQIWDNTDSLNITENGTYNLLGKVINVSVGSQPEPLGNKLRFESLEDNSSFGIDVLKPSQTIEYSLNNGETWNTLTTSNNVTLNNGEIALLRGKNSLAWPDNTWTHFVMSGRIAAKGNIMYLYDYEQLEITTISVQSAFRRLFAGCTSLVEAPELPATTLTKYCYGSLFAGCTSLVEAPALPATSLNEDCYYLMFDGCTSLTTVSTLPATTLAYGCYDMMFRGCTSLTKTPTLMAQTLTTYCYYQMFLNCTNLNTVITYASDVSAYNCISRWLQNVANSGDFYNLGSATYSTGVSGIPSGWTEHTTLN